MLTMVHVILAVTFILMVDPTIISSNGTCSKPIVHRVVGWLHIFLNMFIPDFLKTMIQVEGCIFFQTKVGEKPQNS